VRLLLAALLLAAVPAEAQEGWIPKAAAELVLLDKIRAQPSTLQVKVGQSGSFGSLKIEVRSCVVRPPDQPQDAAAYLQVTDARLGGDVFHGWVLANTPSVSQMEHPLYDLRLIACH
jgi:hypothetical protein